MEVTIIKPLAWNGSEGYNLANKVDEAILTLLWLRNVASYDGWPERAAAYRGAE